MAAMASLDCALCLSDRPVQQRQGKLVKLGFDGEMESKREQKTYEAPADDRALYQSGLGRQTRPGPVGVLVRVRVKTAVQSASSKTCPLPGAPAASRPATHSPQSSVSRDCCGVLASENVGAPTSRNA